MQEKKFRNQLPLLPQENDLFTPVPNGHLLATMHYQDAVAFEVDIYLLCYIWKLQVGFVSRASCCSQTSSCI